MAKRVKGIMNIHSYNNGVKVRGHNTEIYIVKQEASDRKFAAKNVIFIKSLSANSGYNAGVTHEMSENGKIKLSTVGLTTDALIELYCGLGRYLENVVDSEDTKYKK